MYLWLVSTSSLKIMHSGFSWNNTEDGWIRTTWPFAKALSRKINNKHKKDKHIKNVEPRDLQLRSVNNILSWGYPTKRLQFLNLIPWKKKFKSKFKTCMFPRAALMLHWGRKRQQDIFETEACHPHKKLHEDPFVQHFLGFGCRKTAMKFRGANL